MRYFILVVRGQSRAEALGAALADPSTYKPAAVYVAAADDAASLAIALTDDDCVEADELSPTSRASFGYVEAIGTEEHVGDLARLKEFARRRIEELRVEELRRSVHR